MGEKNYFKAKTYPVKLILSCINLVARNRKMKIWVDLAVLRTYVENQAIQEQILFCCALKCTQTKEQGRKDCYRLIV